MSFEELLAKVRFDARGLAPVIVQDAKSKDVLMLAWVNEAALRASWKSGYAHYWSRSRQKLWKKGETSGNVQKLKKICIDCDADALLFVVEQVGFACHTGSWSCFSNRCALPGDTGR